ncbi:hypothetical protein [Pseudomonas asplenii]|uniref:Uncharacterized protein n=1 Tax=Pseudomonas asplenii TaxID=53407 RepID=A0A0M9GDA4_9PSED|nr:hypothetical protein [Pseudomonas fuscovaginae]KPA88249.1 hypothetical protein PF66_05303 [Pseudomonas fuscovaginae]KPA95534.1 hypothetical protein PF70_04459 [Pseudomonas fuscovaginae]
MNTSADIGKSIRDSFHFVSRVGAECDHLAKLIREEFSRLLLTAEIEKRYRVAGKWIDKSINDAHGWVCLEMGSSLPLIIRPKQKIGGYLFVQISLAGHGTDAKDPQGPLLHVGWWHEPIDFDEYHMGFPLVASPCLTLEEQRLFKWTYSASETEWCYSLRLTDINSPADVQTHIIRPMKALLLGKAPADALSGTAAVRYESVNDNTGYYRILAES